MEDAERPTWADRRLSFGSGARDYDRFRPGYPDEAVRWCSGAAGARVVDLGAGTGLFAGAAHRLGYDVLAVEPDRDMRELAEHALPGRTTDGTAESIPVADHSVDTVIAAQAYHWFDPETAHAEIARVLRPGGQFSVVWNTRDDRVPWMAELSDLIEGEDRYSAVDDLGAPDFGAHFTSPESAQWPHRQRLSVDELVGLVGSYSFVRLRADRDEILHRVGELGTRVASTRTQRLAMPYVACGYRSRASETPQAPQVLRS